MTESVANVTTGSPRRMACRVNARFASSRNPRHHEQDEERVLPYELD